MPSLNLPEPDRVVGDIDHTPDHNLIVSALSSLNVYVDGISSDQVYVGPVPPVGDRVKVWIDTSS